MKRKIAVAVAVIVAIVIATAIACSGSSAPALALTGTWTGTYTCSQGLTGVRLVLQANKNGTLTGTGYFYAVPANPGVPSGSYTVTGSWSGTKTNVNAGHWLKQPAGWELENFTAGPPVNGHLSGKVVPASACTTFTVTKELGGNIMGYIILAFFVWCLFAVPAGWLMGYVESKLSNEPIRLMRSILLVVFLGWLGGLIIVLPALLEYLRVIREDIHVQAAYACQQMSQVPSTSPVHTSPVHTVTT